MCLLPVPFGIRYLCGNGHAVSFLSFYPRSIFHLRYAIKYETLNPYSVPIPYNAGIRDRLSNDPV